jgi:hypothetical protein
MKGKISLTYVIYGRLLRGEYGINCINQFHFFLLYKMQNIRYFCIIVDIKVICYVNSNLPKHIFCCIFICISTCMQYINFFSFIKMIFFLNIVETLSCSEQWHTESYKPSLPSHRACCYIYFIQTNSCTLFKTHSHSHLKH